MQKKVIELVITVALKAELPLAWLKEQEIPILTVAGLASGILNKTVISRNVVIVITGIGEDKNKEAIEAILKWLNPIYIFNIGTCAVKEKEDWFTWFNCTPDSPLPLQPSNYKIGVIQSQNTPFKDDEKWPTNVTCIDMEMQFQKKELSNKKVLFASIKFATDSGKETDYTTVLKHLKSEITTLLTPLTQSIKSTDITVVIPTYNRAHHLARCIESVTAQTSQPKAIIVIDDGSIDASLDIIQNYPQITCIKQSKNSGVSAARNIGWRMADTKWIAFLDSDDEWHPKKLECQINYLNDHPLYSIIQSQERWIRNGKHLNQKKYHQKQSGFIWGLSLERCMISPSSVLLKKELLEQFNGFDEALPACEDYDLWLKISRNYLIGLDRSISLIKYGGHADQLSGQHSLDKFRITALKNQLDRETSPIYSEKIKKIYLEKRTIYENGIKKRRMSV